jgi:hypothetical protein
MKSTYRKWNQRAFWLCFLWLATYYLLLRNIPAKWQWCFDLGELFVQLVIGYLSSVIFFTVMDLQKEQNDKKNINPSLRRRIKDIQLSGRKLYCSLRQGAGESYRTESWDYSQNEIDRLCGNIRLSDTNTSHEGFIGDNHVLYKYTHGQIFRGIIETEIPTKTRNIYYYSPFMDAEMIRLLEELDLSKLRQRVESLEYRAEATAMYASKWFFDYFKVIEELSDYAKYNLEND